MSGGEKLLISGLLEREIMQRLTKASNRPLLLLITISLSVFGEIEFYVLLEGSNLTRLHMQVHTQLLIRSLSFAKLIKKIPKFAYEIDFVQLHARMSPPGDYRQQHRHDKNQFNIFFWGDFSHKCASTTTTSNQLSMKNNDFIH